MKPNILWIGVDQMRADSLGIENRTLCQTPHLDQLASQGARFTRAYTPCSLCTPARASMFTGQYAFRHGMGTNCDMYHYLAAELPNPQDLLHYRLQDMGYRTGYTGKWHVGTGKGPGDYGFEGMSLPGYGNLRETSEFQQYLAENGLRYGAIKEPIYANPDNQTLVAGQWNGPLESTPTYYLANATLDLLDDFARTYRDSQQPFFLTCQFWGPHGPYLPSPEYVGRHKREDIPAWENFSDDFSQKPRSVERVRRDFFSALPEDWESWQEIVGLAYDFTSLVDDQIGRLLNHLDELGLADDTVVIVTSDHGDMLGSHGGQHDKGLMYEEAHRVPLIVRLPGQDATELVLDQLVYNMDIMPTIFELLEQSPGENIQSQSLLPYLNDPSAKGRDDIYLEFHGLRCLHTQRALITDDGWKYIFTPVDEDEVYNLIKDPMEMDNLLDHPEVQNKVSVLRDRLIAVSKRVHDPVRDYISKLFGKWEDLSGQIDVSSNIR